MATAPQYAGTVLMGSGAVSATADTSYTAPTNITTIVTAGTSGSKIDEIVFMGDGSTVAGTVNVFLFDGSNYHIYDSVGVVAVTAGAQAPPWRMVKTYANLLIANGWSLRVTSTVASQLIVVSAFGGSF